MILITLITAVLAKYQCNTESYLDLNEDETIRQSIQIGITKYSAVMTQNRILILNQELNEKYSIDLPQINTNWISLLYAQNIIYVISNGTSSLSPQMTAINCEDVETKGCSQFGEKLLPVTSAYGLILDWQLVENSLLILTTSQLRFYNLSTTASGWTLRTTKYNLDNDFFDYQWSTPQKFDVQQYIVDGNKNYKIFIVENYNGFWVDCAVRSKQLIPYINGRINFYTPEFQYAYVIDCKFIKDPVVDGEQITSYIFLQTSSQSIQQIMKMTHTNFDIISYSVVATLVPFKSLQPIIGSIQYFDENTITMMVSDTNISWLTFYNISNINSQTGQIIQYSQYILLLPQDKYDSYVMNLENNSQKFNFKSDDNAITQCDNY